MSGQPDPKPDLGDASDTDEVYSLAYRLAAWGLRHGECDEHSAVDWVLDHPHEAQLPRGSRARLNPTKHHITSGAKSAVEDYDPQKRRSFDPGPLHELAARVSGSGVTHERYLLGVIALCLRPGYQTYTPVVTGPLLAEVVGVSKQNATEVLRKWSDTLAYGFFTRVSYDGIRGHGRVWTVNPEWVPVSKPKHEPGCNRSRARCRCVSQNGLPIFAAVKDRSPKVRQFEEWATTLSQHTPLTVTSVARELGVTRAAATKILRDHEGTLLHEGTFKGRLRQRGADGKFRWVQGERWFVARDHKRKAKLTHAARMKAAEERYTAELEAVSACRFVECDAEAPVGQRFCDHHEQLIQAHKESTE